jgi:hypothetical protein
MLPNDDTDPASLVLGGLRVWVHEKAPESVEWYEGTWLQVRAECAAPGATVTVRGPLLTAEDIGRLLSGMEAMHRGEARAVEMSPLEPNLVVGLTSNSRGGLRIDVRLTPDSMTQEHRFFFDADLAYLAGPIAQCREVLHRFPAEARA